MSEFAGMWGPEAFEYLDGGHMLLAPVKILQGNSGSVLATVYADRDRSAIVANPVFTDTRGNLSFYANPGPYRIEVGNVQTSIYVQNDPDEPSDISEEQVDIIVENASEATMEALEPPVNLTDWFENQLM